MAATYDQFIAELSHSGLLTPEELAQAAGEVGIALDSSDLRPLSLELVRRGKLTPFQASAAMHETEVPLVLGEYDLLDRIGAGGMGKVYKARHRLMDRLVALKVLHPAATGNPQLVQRFYREVKAAARLSHPNIVTAHDAGEDVGGCYLVCEYVEGMDLSALIHDRGPLPVDEAVNCVLQAARGLAYAHARGVVHRDIKPSNLLLDRNGTVKVLDMGLARLVEEADAGTVEQSLTVEGRMMGTAAYMAPEQAVNPHLADPRSDIYSLGCTLYRLLTGEVPYPGETSVQIAIAQRERPIPNLLKRRPEATPVLQEVFARMVSKKPEDRYASMEHVITALHAAVPGAACAVVHLMESAFAVETTSPTPTTLPETSPPAPSWRRHPILLGAVALAVMVMGGILTIAMLRPSQVAAYDAIAKGQWVSLLDSPQKLPSELKGAKINDGILELEGQTAWRLDLPAARDTLIRAQVRHMTGSSLAMFLRESPQPDQWAFCLVTAERDGDRMIAKIIRQSSAAADLRVIAEGPVASPPAQGQWFELAFSAVGPTLTAYVNGRKVAQAQDPVPNARGHAVISMREDDRVQLKQMQVMNLDAVQGAADNILKKNP